MHIQESLALVNDRGWEKQLKNRSIARALGPFIPASEAGDAMPLDPEITIKRILAILEGYEVCWSSGTGPGELMLRKEGHVVFVNFAVGFLNLQVISKSPYARKILKGLFRRLKPFAFLNKEEDGIWADFSYKAEDGHLSRTTSFLRCPRWEMIRQNYPSTVRQNLHRLLQIEEPWRFGRLMIWHGPPGTGKTFAIRALMMEWRQRFSFLVVTDPERLARDPGYYYEVASRSSDLPGRYRGLPREESELYEGEEPSDAGKRRLIILEDTADLILQESRSSHFDKIGKLLNMTDGLFGQGREDVFLFTFNEEVERIDPAFLRPGRCIANLEFPKFGATAASSWFRDHGVRAHNDPTELTLAEMYARLLAKGNGENGERHANSRALGFHGGQNGR